MHAVGFNPTDSPVVIDDEGRTVEGRGFAPVDTTADPVRTAVDADPPRLVLHKAPFDAEQLEDAPADVRAVFAEVERLEAERKGDSVADDQAAAAPAPEPARAAAKKTASPPKEAASR